MNLQYPIGLFNKKEDYSSEEINQAVLTLEQLPTLMKIETINLQKSEYSKTYRTGGWTITQIIHHLADSHMNAFIRTKLALTEDKPMIKPYQEALWAIQTDYDFTLLDASLQLLEAVHTRWVVLLNAISDDEWTRKYFHPDLNEYFNIKQIVMLYKWHGLHHLEHIKIAKQS